MPSYGAVAAGREDFLDHMQSCWVVKILIYMISIFNAPLVRHSGA